MTAKTTKQPRVTLTITPGPVSNYQLTCWKKWWAARFSEAKSKVEK